MKRNLWSIVALLAFIAVMGWAFYPKATEVEVTEIRTGRFERSIDEDGKIGNSLRKMWAGVYRDCLVDGVSRTLEGYYRTVNPTSLSVAAYSSSTFGGAIGFGIPITETDSVT